MAGAGGHIAGPMRPACLGGRPIGQCWETDLISNKTGILYIQCMLCILRNKKGLKMQSRVMADMFSKGFLAWSSYERVLKSTATPPFKCI